MHPCAQPAKGLTEHLPTTAIATNPGQLQGRLHLGPKDEEVPPTRPQPPPEVSSQDAVPMMPKAT